MASRLAFVMALGITVSGAQAPKETEPPPEGIPSVSCHKAIATQNRINRYFHRGVVPNLLGCWGGIPGSGTVAISFGFTRDKEAWVPVTSRVRSSTLKDPADADRALACLKTAMRGTAFPVEADDHEIGTFNVHWSFPVPFPKDLEAAAARMATDTGGGAGNCGGSEGPKEACWDCFYVPIIAWSWCSGACVGMSSCAASEGGCNLGAPRCATGSLFGNIGGLLKY